MVVKYRKLSATREKNVNKYAKDTSRRGNGQVIFIIIQHLFGLFNIILKTGDRTAFIFCISLCTFNFNLKRPFSYFSAHISPNAKFYSDRWLKKPEKLAKKPIRRSSSIERRYTTPSPSGKFDLEKLKKQLRSMLLLLLFV